MNRCPSILWTILLVVSLAGSAVADEGWSFSDLNPFASKSKTAKSTPTRKISDTKSSSKSAGWSLNPFAKSSSTASSTKNTSTRRKSEPSMLTKTWEAITPWDEHPVKKPAPLVNPRPSKGKVEKGWFDSMFGEEEPRRPRTVNEWLDQEKPGF